MKNKIVIIYLGILLIIVSGILLAEALGNIILIPAGAIVFVVASAASFLAYFLHGLRKWGWLIPAIGSLGMALTIWMEDTAIGETITPAPLFASLALPFFVGFAVDRKRQWRLIPATFLTAFTVFLLVPDTVKEVWSGVIFLWLFALSLFVTYFLLKRPWWLLIPAGGFASLGLVVLVEILIPHQDYPALPNTLSWGVYTWVLFLGLSATFGAVWLHHKTAPTDWAKYPAAGLLAIAVLAMLLREHFQEVWLAVMTLAGGVTLLLMVFTRKKRTTGQQTPNVKAETP